MSSLHVSSNLIHSRNVIKIVLAIGAIIPMFASPAHGDNRVTNGSFESPFVDGQFETYYGVDATSLTGWVVDHAGTSINHVNAQWNDADGFQSIDLNGIEAGSIYQDLSTTASQEYTIRFALAGNPEGQENKRLQVLWDGVQIADVTFVQAGHDPINMGWTYYQFVAAASDNSTRLTFNSLTGAMQGDGGVQTWYGPVIDDVSVNPVPEPTGPMLALASSLFVLIVRRPPRVFGEAGPHRKSRQLDSA
jgi:choice-of-anchor C domain-containing protein